MPNWWPIAKHLVEFLKVRPLFADWSVYPGTKGTAKRLPCVEVQWDQEAALSVHKPNEGSITLWADIWVRSDKVESDEVYQQQHDAQSVIFDCLREWAASLIQDLGMAAKVDCPGIASEGTITRPSFGCRMIITVDWRKR